MEHEQYEKNLGKLYSPRSLLLCVGGLGINLALSKLVIALGLPLYLDNVGSILVGALGGSLPGMAVGFLSNCVGSVTEPISLYYGIITVLIAWLAAKFSRKGYFNSLRGCAVAVAAYVALGGALGSVMTWALYGGTIGGMAEPWALRLAAAGWPPFAAQLTVDVLLDIPDKLLTVGLVWLVLRGMPASALRYFPLGGIYDGTAKADAMAGKRRGTTINARVTNMVMGAVALTSLIAIGVSVGYHARSLFAGRGELAKLVSVQAADCVDGDAVEQFLREGEAAPGYAETKARLRTVLESTVDAKYLFVYRVQPDGVAVVFDLDVPGVQGDAPGTLLVDEQGVSSHYGEYLNGEEIPAEFTRGEYGNILTVYSPIYAAGGTVAAYAGVDIDMTPYLTGTMTFAIQVISIVFAAALVIFATVLWYINRQLTEPICLIVDQVGRLDGIRPDAWVDSDEWKNRVQVHTGDELEELYHTVYHVEENAAHSMQQVMAAEQKLLETKELAAVNEKLAAAIRKADEANRSKTDFMSRMSHDMRTPMNGILGLARLSADENNVDVLHDNMGKIEVAGVYLLGLVNDTLDIQKIESGNITLENDAVNLGELFDSVCQMTRASAEQKGVELREENGAGTALVRTDAMRIRQVLTNLLTNAIKFTPEGGSIVVRLECDAAAGDKVCSRLTVQDSGIGMSREFLENGIFKPFSQEASDVVTNYGGSGLGLSIAKRLIERMGGQIEVTSELGEGTVFTVRMDFDRVSDDELQALQAKATAGGGGMAALAGRQILLAEDHPLNAEIATRLLKKAGCGVTWVKDGQECLTTFAAAPVGQYDAVLMDIRMPVMGGIEAARAIRALARADAGVPIVALSANAFAEDVKKSLDAGMNAHLSKPVEPGKLYATLGSVLGDGPQKRE